MLRLLSAAALAVTLATTTAIADDKREGYYYPPVTSEEVFERVINNPPVATAPVRASFVTQITKAQLAAPESPRFVLFEKGSGSEHMIIIALDDEVFRTLYRARAQLAQLTANARSTDFFVNNNLQVVATWFDLAKMLGFEDIVVSDGMTWSHRIILK